MSPPRGPQPTAAAATAEPPTMSQEKQVSSEISMHGIAVSSVTTFTCSSFAQH